MKNARRLLLTILISGVCGPWAHGQLMNAEHSRTPLAKPGYHLNKIFSTGSSFGPLAQNRHIQESDQLLLFWSQPPNGASSGSYDAYRYQMMNFLTASKQLNSDGALSGDSVTDAVDGSQQPAVGGNKNSTVLAGDMSGDGYAEAVSVWESANHQVFASAMPVNKADFTFSESGVTGELVGTVMADSSDYDGEIAAKLVDFTGNGQQDLVLAWVDPTDSKVHLAVYAWSASAASHLTLVSTIADMLVDTSQSYTRLIALTTGEFKQDSRAQIALAGFKDATDVYVKMYYLDGSNTMVAAAERVSSIAVSSWRPNSTLNLTASALSGTISRIALVAGNFTGDSYRDDIAVAITSSGSIYPPLSDNALIYIAHPDTGLDSIAVPFQYTSYPTQSLSTSIQPATALACGDLNGTGKDELILGAWNEILVFQVNQGPFGLVATNPTSTVVSGPSNVAGDFTYSNSFLQVGDVNEDGKDEVVVLRNVYSPIVLSTFPSITLGYLQTFDVTVLASADTSFDLTNVASTSIYAPDTTAYDPGSIRHYSLALGNFDGNGILLGQPAHYYATNVVQPLVILNAPPVHFDVFNDTSYDICSVFNGGGNSGNFATTYNHSTSSTDMMETNVTSSWGVGASLSGDVSGPGVKVSASLDTHYGKDFSKVQNSSYQNTVTVNVSAQQQDEIYAIINNYDLWEYPVIDSGQVRGHVLVTVPGPPQGQWFDTESWTAYSFIPDHVVGNVLSYLTYDSLQSNPYLAQKIKGSLSDGFELGTGNFSWNLATQDFTSSSASETESFNLNVSADVEVGGEFAGFGASVKAGVSGDYSHSSLTSHTSSVTDALSLTAQLGSINQSIGEDQYVVTPYSYWGNTGALVVDYAVQPVLAPPGATETWWQQKYGHAPDPALALPYRYWPQEGFAVQDPEKLYQTKEIFCDPSNPSPGDTVTTFIRIHNYSLVSTDSAVQVSFYIGNPQTGGTLITSLTGGTVFSTAGPIAARSAQVLSFKWKAPASVKPGFVYSGDYVRVWAVVDPNNRISEIHEDNNVGWNLLEVPGIMTGVESTRSQPVSYQLYQNYPNPFNPSTTIRFDLKEPSTVRLEVYNILGQRVYDENRGMMNAGQYNDVLDMSRFASGAYIYRIEALGNDGQRFVSTKKLLLLK